MAADHRWGGRCGDIGRSRQTVPEVPMSLSTSVIPLILLCILGRIVYQYFSRKVCIKRRKAYIDAFLLPTRVARKLKERHPHLDERDISDVFRELKEYFHIIRESRDNGNEAFVSMPSLIADEAWHEFILATVNTPTFVSGPLVVSCTIHPPSR
jgi:hypothetical protein